MTDSRYRELLKKSPQTAHRAVFDEYYSYVYTIVFNKLRSIASLEDVDECISDVFSEIFLKYDEGSAYSGDIKTDHYGRQVPVHAHGTINLSEPTSSSKEIDEAVKELFDRITDPTLSIRRINVTANHVIPERKASADNEFIQLDFFTDQEEKCRQAEKKRISHEREKSLQQALLNIRHKYGKNAILKGANYQSGATARERNQQIGGHRA